MQAMRWIVSGALTLFILWAIYIVSPYWALREFAVAVEHGDSQDVVERVNFRALRVSLAKQLVSAGMAEADPNDTLGPSELRLVAGTIAVADEPLVDNLLTAAGVIGLLGHRTTAAEADSVRHPFDIKTGLLTRLGELLRASTWRGFRNVYFSLPPGAPTGRRYRLQLRLSRMTWRLVAIELPADLRQRLVERIIGRRRSAKP